MKTSSPLSSLEITDLLKGWESSGLTQRVYCSKKGINYHCFKTWRKKYSKASSSKPVSSLKPHAFILLEVSDSGSESSFQIHYPNGMRLECDKTTHISLLKTLISLLYVQSNVVIPIQKKTPNLSVKR